MNDSNSSNRGCLTAALIVAALLAIGGIVIAASLFWFKAKAMDAERHHYEEAQKAHAAHEMAMRSASGEASHGPAVVLDRSTVEKYSATELGEMLDAKHYVAITTASNLTNLAEQRFIEAADGMPIEWQVQVEDIRADPANEGQITGQFSMPYEIREGHSSFGSSISITTTFSPEKADELISLRSGESVRIRGRLKILKNRTNSIKIIDPKILKEDEAKP